MKGVGDESKALFQRKHETTVGKVISDNIDRKNRNEDSSPDGSKQNYRQPKIAGSAQLSVVAIDTPGAVVVGEERLGKL